MSNAYTTQDIVTMHAQVAMLFRQDKRADVAAALGIHPAGLSRRLSGGVPWTLDEVDVLARHFGCKPADLLVDVPDFLGSITLPEDRTRFRREHFEEAGVPAGYAPRRRRGGRAATAEESANGRYRSPASAYELAA